MTTNQTHADAKQDSPSTQPYIEANYVIRRIIAGMVSLVISFAAFFVTFFMPLKEKVAVMETKMGVIDEGIRRIEGKVDKVAGVITKDSLPTLFTALTTAPEDRAEAALSAVERLTEIAKEKSIPLAPHTFREIGQNLLKNNYQQSELKNKARETVSKLATYKTSLQKIPEEAKKEAQANCRYYQDQKIVLNNKIYTNAIFENCEIIYQQNPLDQDFIALIEVRLINCFCNCSHPQRRRIL